jgi:hypothetical protein
MTVIQKTLPCIVTAVTANKVILRHRSVELANILRTSINIDSLVNVHAAANIN